MQETDYAGIDYGLGKTNREQGTGLAFGVISRHTLSPDTEDAVELDYGEPHCPQCGEPVKDPGDFDHTAECGVWQCQDCGRVAYPMELETDDEADDMRHLCPECAGPCVRQEFTSYHEHGCHDFVCLSCHLLLDSECVYPEQPVELRLEENGLLAKDCLDSDWVILQSKFITRAQFCSPCVPGAGNLDTPCETGPITLCFGHSWFEHDLAPYPVVEREPYLKDGTLSMVLSDGSTRQYQNWETIFCVWQMRKGT